MKSVPFEYHDGASNLIPLYSRLVPKSTVSRMATIRRPVAVTLGSLEACYKGLCVIILLIVLTKNYDFWWGSEAGLGAGYPSFAANPTGPEPPGGDIRERLKWMLSWPTHTSEI